MVLRCEVSAMIVQVSQRCGPGIGLSLTLTEVSTTCVVVIFRIN